ncbi:hypothetical protein ABZ484_12500 [Streptomyces sp. NPDC006393]|uniref:hypothetical protein n=1 Tax=Streptomyces sp. NPDC006393 TaxID=3156763 RepID=UPI0033D724F5
MRSARAAAVSAALLVGLTTGCAGHAGTAPKAAPSGSASSAAPSGSPSGYADMQKKVDAAESAVAAADRDAASDDDR